MKDRIKDYFAFTRKEQRGLIVLLGLMLLTIAAYSLMPWFIPDKEFDITPFQKQVEEFLASVDTTDKAKNNKSYTSYPGLLKTDEPVLQAFIAAPFSFNPNEISRDEWISMGMNDKIAANIIRYRDKGGVFRNKEGFRKIYGMTDEIFSILEPYLEFPARDKPYSAKKDSSNSSGNYSRETNNKSSYPGSKVIELNTADSISLLELPGIGPSFAGRITRYRDRLGGYFIKEQLLEIKGMDSIRFNQIRDQILVDQGNIRKIDLNSVTFKDLLKHPYFEYYLVKEIFKKKDEIKRYDSIDQLNSLPVMYKELFEKIIPYLVVYN
jgi:DNA uptake protein ComE-like DNA-binding protein